MAAETLTARPAPFPPTPDSPGKPDKRSPGHGWVGRYVVGLVGLDVTVAVLASWAALGVVFGAVPLHANVVHLVMAGALPIAWPVVLAANQCYDRRQLFVGSAEYDRVVRSGVVLVALVALAAYLGDLGLSRAYTVVSLAVTVPGTVLGRMVMRRVLHHGRRHGRWLRRVVVVGHVRAVADLCRQLRRERYHGMSVAGACVPVANLARHGGLDRLGGHLVIPDVDLPVYGSFDDAAYAVEAAQADAVIVLSCPELDGPAVRRLAWQVENDDTDLILANSLMDVSGGRITVRPVDGLPMLQVTHPRLRGTGRLAKALSDRIGAALLLALTWPLLAAAIAWIRLTSPGPALFRQVRVGRDGRPFTMIKLRTMYVDAEHRLAGLRGDDPDNVLFKLHDDPRVTRAGRVLRALSVDELPQLFNVLAGHMSLVGPRPPLPDEVARYPADMGRRLVVRPGITGLWQVSGRADLSFDDAVRLDLRYVDNWSLSLDLVILLRTVTAVLRRSGAY
ncbi:sugar transferase [Actinocatenispora comari]|uniref:sugar transferase n=1 Tax=Actinocatenispora comari TaxID=2807577 RepID=UPI001CECE3F2|nr:sugar transferase [Actinocatenispora comari]